MACSRAIENMFIFTTYTIHTTSKGTVFKINPWFQLIQPKLYEVSEGFENIKYPELEFKNDTFIDASVTKIISKFNPDKKLFVFYKYEYFNHDHINEYQNVLEVDNGFIVDGILG